MISKLTLARYAAKMIVIVLLFASSCTKPADPEPEPAPPPPLPAPAQPKTFPVSVKMVSVNAALVIWVPPQRAAGDTLTYTVYFENVLFAANYKPEEYYFGSLKGAKTYSGRVVARYPNGDSLSTDFTFTTLRGSLFLIEKDYLELSLLRCYDLSGKEQWKFQVPFEDLSYAFLSGDTVYTFSKTRLFCINANNGLQYWSKNIQFVPEKPPVMTESKILYMSDLRAVALNKSDGSMAWQSARYSITGLTIQTTYKDLFFMRVDYETLYAFDANTGAVMWQSQPPSTSYYSYPVVANDIIIMNNEIEVYALDAFNGSLKWSIPLARCNAPITSNGVAFITSEETMTAIEIKTGRVLWQKSGLGFSVSNPTADEKNVYCLSYTDPASTGSLLVSAFDLKTGGLSWKASQNNLVYYSDPIVADGILFFTSLNPYVLHKVDANNGNYIGNVNTMNPTGHGNISFTPFIVRVIEKNYYPAFSGLTQ